MNRYDLAKKLSTKNWQCIPLDIYKKPMLSFADEVITNEFLESNQELYLKSQGLGVLTRGVWCIDVDRNHSNDADGFNSLKEISYFDELDKNAGSTMLQQTPSGGLHIIFIKNEGVAYGQKINYLSGVDIKANDNNYFVLAGSVSTNGKYRWNGVFPKPYEGEFEHRIFDTSGTFEKQIEERYSIKNVLSDYDFSYLPAPKGKGGLGKQAYSRIVEGVSVSRNDDLFLAVGYAMACDVEIEPLKTLIGTRKNNDIFTEKEFWKTVESAMRNYKEFL